jgi:hypothetical protein
MRKGNGIEAASRGGTLMSAMQSQLMSGEQILWEGKPYTGLILRPIEFFLIPFSLFWGGFAFFWNIEAAQGSADLGFQLFGLPFLAMGLYITFGRFLLDIYLRRNVAMPSPTNASSFKKA